MFNCCGKDAKSICEQLECNVKETAKGIQVDISAKDASKTESLKALIKACHEFCGCCQEFAMSGSGPASWHCDAYLIKQNQVEGLDL